MNAQETNLQRDARQMGEAQARLRGEMAESPQFAAMAEAIRLTPKEQAAVQAAQDAVTEAEAAVDAAGMAVTRAERGRAPTYDQKRPFSFFEKSKGAHKAAADAALPGLRIDLQEARSLLQNAIRRRNGVTRGVEVARMERRRAAKLDHTPKREPVKSRGDRWNHPDAA